MHYTIRTPILIIKSMLKLYKYTIKKQGYGYLVYKENKNKGFYTKKQLVNLANYVLHHK